jgi:hypothetical protein
MATPLNFAPLKVIRNPRSFSNSPIMTITVSNMAHDTIQYNVATDLTVSNLKNQILRDGFVEGIISDMRLFKQPNMNNINTQVVLDNPIQTLTNAGIVDGDTLYVVMDPLPNTGGKRSRRKSHRRRKTRGKKSRKH